MKKIFFAFTLVLSLLTYQIQAKADNVAQNSNQTKALPVDDSNTQKKLQSLYNELINNKDKQKIDISGNGLIPIMLQHYDKDNDIYKIFGSQDQNSITPKEPDAPKFFFLSHYHSLEDSLKNLQDTFQNSSSPSIINSLIFPQNTLLYYLKNNAPDSTSLDLVNKEASNFSATNNAANNILQAENFLMSNSNFKYDATQQKNASLYYQYMERLASPLFVIGFNCSSDSCTASMPYPSNTASEQTFNKNIYDDLKMKQFFADYRLRSLAYVTANSLFQHNIAQTYLKRYPMSVSANSSSSTAGSNSLASIEQELASLRLSKDYRDSVIAANPAILQREEVLLLGELNWRLQELQKTNELLLLTQSVNGLLQLRNTKTNIDQLARVIGHYIDCRKKANNDTSCMADIQNDLAPGIL